MNLSIKKATTISGTNLVLIRGLFHLLALIPIVYQSKTITWKKSSYDKNTFIVRLMIGGIGTIFSALAV